MKEHRIGIIMNGVTGRMGKNQHLLRSIHAIRQEGGIPLSDGSVIVPDPLLVGRNPNKLQAICHETGIHSWTTDLDSALSNSDYGVYFDSQTTAQRFESVGRAIEAGKHIYCEKPVSLSTEEGLDLYRRARQAGVKQGVVQDKLWLPGIQKLRTLIKKGFFGEILSIRGEFGYWVFEGDTIPSQRPSWNYRREAGGGIMADMFPHWRYLLDNVFGGVQGVSAIGATHVSRRWNESGQAYEATADDAAYATFRLAGGAIAQFNSSWAVRVRRDDLFTLQVDGMLGSAVAGLRDCWIQSYAATPRPVWNPDVASPLSYLENWQKLPDQTTYPNAFRAQWELFLRHVVEDSPFPWDLLEGAKGVQLAEKGMESWKSGSWLEVEELTG